MDIRLIATDLDGTLLNEHSTLSPRTAATLRRAAEMGITLVAATGRAYRALPEEIRTCPALSYAITSNGTGIYRMRDGMRIYTNPMSHDNLEQLLAFLADEPYPMEAFLDGVAYADQRYVEDPLAFHVPEHTVGYVKRTRIPCPDIPALVRANPGRVEGMDIIVTDPVEKARLRDAASRIPDLYVTTSVAHYLEFATGSASKATALYALTSQLGLDPAQVMSFGDGENDLEMLRFSGLGVAMGNAVPALLSAADQVTETNVCDGVAQAIARWVTGF